jgi:hypothetical protein
LRITSDPEAKYEDYEGYSRSDPNQGWDYPDMDSDSEYEIDSENS